LVDSPQISDIPDGQSPRPGVHSVTFNEAFWVWLTVAALSFGGPAGQIAVMHRIVVEERKWVSESRFLHALNYCMLLPGPEAQQLATYLGWLMHRTRGGLMAGGLFILPGAVAIMALSVVYTLYGQVGIVAAVFFGLKSAVLAIVVEAVIRVGKRALRNRALLAIAGGAFVAIFFFNAPFPAIILTAGLVGYAGALAGRPEFTLDGGHGKIMAGGEISLLGDAMPEHARRTLQQTLLTALIWLVVWLSPVVVLLLTLGPGNVFSQIEIFFSTMAVVTFGGAYAVLAYVAQEVVQTQHWLTPGEMLDGLGMAKTTPGPLIMVLQFVGFLAVFRHGGGILAGVAGGLLATWVTFTPCFLWIFVGAPYIERLRGAKALTRALSAITAAVVGVILNLAIWFAVHSLFGRVRAERFLGLHFDAPDLRSANLWAIALAISAALAIFRFRIGMLATLVASAGAGIALHLSGMMG
jgi:chromate transporter